MATLINGILIFIAMSCTPFVELRLAVPFALSHGGLNFHPVLVLFLAVITHFIMGAAIYEGLHYIRQLSKIHPRTHKMQESFFKKAHNKLKPYIDKYGHWGMAVFIAIPIPGSGVLTGSIASQLLKIERKHYYLANVVGVSISTLIIMLISLGFVTL